MARKPKGFGRFKEILRKVTSVSKDQVKAKIKEQKRDKK